MEKENNTLITLGNLKNTSYEEISKIKIMDFSKIEESCQNYNPNTNYLQVLTNILLLKSKVQEGVEHDLS